MSARPKLLVELLPALAFTGMVAAVLACGDPQRDAAIEALGGEADGFGPSAIHRPGQPCVLCHSSYFGAEPNMSLAGTLFYAPGSGFDPFLVGGYTVRVLDSEGESRDLLANRCGNFYIEKSDWDPAFPVRAVLYGPKKGEPDTLLQLRVMASRIGREGSCAKCHVHPRSLYSPGVVHVPGDPADFLPTLDCPPPWLGPNPNKPELE